MSSHECDQRWILTTTTTKTIYCRSQPILHKINLQLKPKKVNLCYFSLICFRGCVRETNKAKHFEQTSFLFLFVPEIIHIVMVPNLWTVMKIFLWLLISREYLSRWWVLSSLGQPCLTQGTDLAECWLVDSTFPPASGCHSPRLLLP